MVYEPTVLTVLIRPDDCFRRRRRVLAAGRRFRRLLRIMHRQKTPNGPPKGAIENNKPGLPMEVVLDSESMRKTPTSIGFRDKERLFGRAAVTLSTRSPELVYHAIPTLLGKKLDHPAVQLFRKQYPYHNMTYDESIGQIVFEHPGGVLLTVEELVAMLLEYARDIAENHAEKGTILRTAVLTVPPYYGQAERRSLIRAAELAGLEVIQLINTGSAVGLNFGVFRLKQFNATPQHYLFFDVGYSDTVATVVSYHVGKHHYDGVFGEDPIMTVLGVGYAHDLGTSTFITLLRDYLAGIFHQQKPNVKEDIFQNKRAMAKLKQEAERVFTMLSANNEVISQVESLFAGQDFYTKVSRKELETVCAEAFEQLRQPFTDALQASNLSVSAIQEIVLMGGGTRVPKVQSILMELGARSELGKGVNGDEAAVLGAVYQAAARTPGFKVVRLILRDYNPHAIAVDFERAPAVASGKGDKTVLNPESSNNTSPHARMVLFSRGSPYPLKRAITFNRHMNDLTFYVNYVDVPPKDSAYLGVTNLTVVTTNGVASVVDRFKQAEMRGVKAHFMLDHSGLLILTGVDCVLHPLAETTTESAPKDESTLQKLGNKISGFFGGGSSAESEQTVPETGSNSTAESQTNNSSSTNTTDTKSIGDNTNNNTSTSSATKEVKTPVITKKPAPFTERVNFDLVHVDANAPTDDHRAAFKQKLNDFRQADQDRRDLERAMNDLESTLFSTREKVQSEVYGSYSTADDLSALNQLLTAHSEWYEEQSIATPREYISTVLFDLEWLVSIVVDSLLTTHATTWGEMAQWLEPEFTDRIYKFEEKLSDIRKLLLPIELRVKEAEQRPKAVQGLNESLTEAVNFLSVMRDTMTRLKTHMDELTKNQTSSEGNATVENTTKTMDNLPWPPVFTDSEQKTLEDLINNTQ
ncbi:hypoxia up-regulated 1, partial [Clonorchis sinensis]